MAAVTDHCALARHVVFMSCQCRGKAMRIRGDRPFHHEKWADERPISVTVSARFQSRA